MKKPSPKTNLNEIPILLSENFQISSKDNKVKESFLQFLKEQIYITESAIEMDKNKLKNIKQIEKELHNFINEKKKTTRENISQDSFQQILEKIQQITYFQTKLNKIYHPDISVSKIDSLSTILPPKTS